MRDVLAIFNPTAQSGESIKHWNDLHAAGQTLGMNLKRIDTLPGGKTRDVVTNFVRSEIYPLLLGVGGDGTFTEIIQGIMQAKDQHGIALEKLPRFAVVPLGTGNNVS